MSAPLVDHLRSAKTETSRRIRELRIDAAQLGRKRPVPSGPAIVAGFFGDPRGIARGARLGADALERLGLPIERLDLAPLLRGETPPPPRGEGGALILHVNPPELRVLLSSWPASAWRDRFRVGYWVWELERAPASWRRAAGWVDEIWTPSAFSAGAFESFGSPVRVMPHPVPDVRAPRDRARFGLPEDKPVALVAFDFRSARARKNPDGAVEAFVRAVDSCGIDAVLVVKALAPEADPAGCEALQARAAARRDIRLLAEPLDDAGMDSLVASADVLVSLHRSEGFGLLLAEAMRAGVAVVSTAWSATQELMTETSAALVPCTLVPVEDPGGRYAAPGARWAEPDIDAAAARIAALLGDASLRAAQAEAGRAAIAAALERAYARASLSGAFLAATTDATGGRLANAGPRG